MFNLLAKRNPQMFIPQNNKKGGPGTFMRNMQTYLNAVNYPYTRHYKRGDNIFFMIRYDIKMLEKVKKHGGRVVQRLDGVYLDSDAGDYKTRNQRIANLYHNYADWVILQSDYCKRLCDAVIGERKSSQYRIIRNGVNTDIFYPGRKIFTGFEPIEFVSSGRFRNPTMFNLMLNALDSLQFKLDFRLHVIDQNQLNPSSSTQYARKKYMVVHGSQTMRGVAELLRKSHVYLFSVANPPCPNAVLEAAASGLPVVSFHSGSMPELLPFCTELLAPVSEDLIHRQCDFHADALADKILLAVEKYAQFRKNAVIHANDYPFATCGAAYQEIFEFVTQTAD